MSRDSSGNYTLPAGNPVAGGTLISTTWANPTMADLAAEITNSLDRNGRGGMLVPFLNADGTVITPGISFTNEPSSGLYRPLLTDVRMSIGGDDTTRWIDASLAPIGERRPFEIWNGEAWNAPIQDGDSVTVEDLTVNGVVNDRLTILDSIVGLSLGLEGIVSALPSNELGSFIGPAEAGVGGAGVLAGDLLLIPRTSLGGSLRIFTGTPDPIERFRMDASGNATFAGGVTIERGTQPLVLDAVGAFGSFVYQDFDRDGNKWRFLSDDTSDDMEFRNAAGTALMRWSQATALTQITSSLEVSNGIITAGGSNTNLNLSAIGVAGGVQLITNAGTGLSITSAGNTQVFGSLTITDSLAHVIQITRTGGNGAFVGMDTGSNFGQVLMNSLGNPFTFIRANNALLELGNNGVPSVQIDTTGGVTMPNLAGAGVRTVSVDANGRLQAP